MPEIFTGNDSQSPAGARGAYAVAECKDYSWEGRGTNKIHMCGSVPKHAMSPGQGLQLLSPCPIAWVQILPWGLSITHINVNSLQGLQPGIQPIPMGSGTVAVFMDWPSAPAVTFTPVDSWASQCLFHSFHCILLHSMASDFPKIHRTCLTFDTSNSSPNSLELDPWIQTQTETCTAASFP